jgi:drug/metabolite transporter (DMT)-like permease
MFVALAAVAWSTAGLFQRELSVDTATQVAGRAAFAAVGLLAYVVVVERRGTLRAFRALGLSGLAVAALIAVSSASFIAALNHASVANVLFMMALAPILAAALGTLVGDPVDRRTWAAMAIAVVGVGVMVGGPGHPSALGQLLSVTMSASFAGILVITRHRREISMAPASVLSQLVLLVAFAPFASFADAGPRDVTLLAALGITQYCLGFVFLTIGARLIPAGEVALSRCWRSCSGRCGCGFFFPSARPLRHLSAARLCLLPCCFRFGYGQRPCNPSHKPEARPSAPLSTRHLSRRRRCTERPARCARPSLRT